MRGGRWAGGDSEDRRSCCPGTERHHGALEQSAWSADRMAATAHLGVRARGVDRAHLDVEQLLHCLADLDLVGVDRHAEVVGVAVGGVVGRLLRGSTGFWDDVVEADRAFWTLEVIGIPLPEDSLPEDSALLTRPTRLPSASKAPGCADTRRPLATSKARQVRRRAHDDAGEVAERLPDACSSCSASSDPARAARRRPGRRAPCARTWPRGSRRPRTEAHVGEHASSPSFSFSVDRGCAARRRRFAGGQIEAVVARQGPETVRRRARSG